MKNKIQYLPRFMLFKIKQRKQESGKNEDKIWVKMRACNDELLYTKIF